MESAGKIRDAYRTADRHVVLTVELDGVGSDEELDKMMHEERLRVTVEKYREKRSLNANGYLWALIDKIAKKTGSERWTEYLSAIYKYGCFIDVAVIDRALPIIERTYRYTEIMEQGEMNGEPASVVRCFRGSSTYDKSEMADLIDGVVDDAKSLGIDVLPPDDIKHLIELWEGSFNGK